MNCSHFKGYSEKNKAEKPGFEKSVNPLFSAICYKRFRINSEILQFYYLGCIWAVVSVAFPNQIKEKERMEGTETMNMENVSKCAAYFAPVEMKIIYLVSEGVKIKRIAKALRMDKSAVQRHINIIGEIIREVCNV